MYINTYTIRNREEIEKKLSEYKASLFMLESLKSKGFKTINEAWKSVVKKRISQIELDKFAKLLNDKAEARKDRHSWEWFKKWGGKREVKVLVIGESWRDNLEILTLTIDENLNIERHHCGNSLNVSDHTIESLLNTTTQSILEYENALKLYDSVKERIERYETALKDSVDQLYNLHIKEVDALVYSKSI